MSQPHQRTLLHDASTYSVHVEVPASKRVDLAPESVDVSRLPGARIVDLARFEAEPMLAFAGCASGASDRFAPGLEGVLFDRAAGLAFQTMGITTSDLVVERDLSDARSYEKLTTGRTDRGPLVVHQRLSFTGPERDLLLCTVACAGPGCEQARLVLDGEPPEPPPASTLLRAFFYAAEHPTPVLGGAGVFVLMLVAIVLWRRPYPRP